ncbi:hypothetical protein N9M73_04755, partial [Rhodobacteraceae bacterium]|nr:hypothetical protein [Paracoccaceae bacterium]
INDYRAFFVSNGKLMIAEHLKTVEREVVTAALVAAEDDIDIAARMLHLSVAELVEKKQDLGIRTKPIASNSSNQGREQNRRIEIELEY